MPYSVNMMQCSPSTQMALIGNDYQGFPRPFRYFLLSMWGCLGDTSSRIVSFTNPNTLGSVQASTTQLRLFFIPALSGSPSLDAYYAYPASNVLRHYLVSLDGVAQVAQVYINDTPVAVSSGGWVGPPGQFDISGQSYNVWQLNSSGSASPGPGQGDVYAAAPAAFFDLSITANRRKFINADLTPVDLGSTATSVLGVAPQIWLTARSGVATDFPTNHGTGGGVWNELISTPFTFQPAGMCVVPTAGPAVTKLALDDVLCTTTTTLLTQRLISLRWSDDRGHVYGSPVAQDIGPVGDYLTSLQWQRLGMARDRVFEISWSVPLATALQGAWIDVTPAQS